MLPPAMPAGSLLALLDDISSVLDDVATLTKVATRKTAGVLGDDLALNAEQVTGVSAERELPVVYAVARGSLVNKLILVPAALLVSFVLPAAITPLLMVGGAYLCFEGFEKIVHHFTERRHPRVKMAEAETRSREELEQAKIKGAIRTDFVLSAEIVTIALGAVASYPLLTRVLALSAIGLLMTVGVYGLVALIVKIDDLGLFLMRRGNAVARGFGRSILLAAPYLMKTLSVVGTVAMFLVGGGILAHGVPGLSQVSQGLSGVLGTLVESSVNGLLGVVAGAVLVALFALGRRLARRSAG